MRCAAGLPQDLVIFMTWDGEHCDASTKWPRGRLPILHPVAELTDKSEWDIRLTAPKRKVSQISAIYQPSAANKEPVRPRDCGTVER